MKKYLNLEHKQKNQANIFVHELSKLNQQRDLLLSLLAQTQTNDAIVVDKGKLVVKEGKSMAKLGKSQSSIINTSLIGKRSHLMTPPFLLTFEISNKKVQNHLVYSIESSNVITHVIF